MHEAIIGLIIPVMTLLFAGLFVLLWLRDRRANYILALAGCYAFMSAGFLIQHFTPAPDHPVSILVMHAVYAASVICLAVGVGKRAGVAMPIPAMVGIAVITASLLLATNFSEDQNPRLYLSNSSYGLMVALAAQVLARAGRQERIDKILVLVIGLTAVQFFVRPYVAIIASGAMTSAEYRDSPYYSILLVTVAVLALSLAMALVAACILDQIRRIEAESSRDVLTGLRNRRAFENDAIDMLERANGEDVPVVAIVADIDNFKRVNDRWGHQVGDRAIAGFGGLLAQMVRNTDHVGRIGGEEFCILVWNCELQGAHRLAERIRLTFESSPVEGITEELVLTASFGVAQWEPGEGYGKLFARADAALYSAKEEGRNQVRSARPGKKANAGTVLTVAGRRTAA